MRPRSQARLQRLRSSPTVVSAPTSARASMASGQDESIQLDAGGEAAGAAANLLWLISLAYPIGTILLQYILAVGFRLASRITLDVVEEMQDVRAASETVRNVYTNVALVSALMTTVALSVLTLDHPSAETGIAETFYITAAWMSFLLTLKPTIECVINLVYTEALPSFMVLRYLIAFPGSIGGPVLEFLHGIMQLIIAIGLRLFLTYDLAVCVGYFAASAYVLLALVVLVIGKSRFSSNRNDNGSKGWRWAEQDPVPSGQAVARGYSAFLYSAAVTRMIRKRAEEAKVLELEFTRRSSVVA